MRILKGLISTLLMIMATSSAIHSQNTKPSRIDTVKTAVVEVTVVNSKKEARIGETIILVSQKNNKSYSSRTNAAGKASLKLPAGESYSITLKAFTDTSQYGVVEIPALGEGQYFKDALTVEITYEPARMYTLDGLQFDVGKATIRPTSFKQLLDLFDYLQWKTDEKIEIAGHTDNTGKDADNLVLSQQRAEAVKSWLVKKGISGDRITAKGYGASQPIADNTDEEGRQKNRRTEVRIL